jgi:CxxC-x17-CxxC domain-containing protein
MNLFSQQASRNFMLKKVSPETKISFVNEPQRCKACRQARKNAAKPARELFETTCAECGGVAKIPFKPMEGKSYYCSDCFAKRK